MWEVLWSGMIYKLWHNLCRSSQYQACIDGLTHVTESTRCTCVDTLLWKGRQRALASRGFGNSRLQPYSMQALLLEIHSTTTSCSIISMDSRTGTCTVLTGALTCTGVSGRLQPVLHVALRIVAPSQLVPLGRHHLVRQVLQQVVQQPCVPCRSALAV